MANFDYKTATPDTSFPSGGFLFGADSQSATDPSIYSHTAYLNYILSLANTWTATQTITPATNTNALAVTGYSLTGSNAQSLIDLAGTWNTTGTPTAIKLNVTNTASNAASLLLDLQVGGTSQFKVSRDGFIDVPANGGIRGTANLCVGGSGTTIFFGANTTADNDEVAILTSTSAGNSGIRFSSGGTIGWSGLPYANTAPDLIITRDAANTLAQRNSTNAQTFRIYNTYTDASNYERLEFVWSGNISYLRNSNAGTGSARILVLNVTGDTTQTIAVGSNDVTFNRDLLINGRYMQFVEQTAPSAPSTDRVRIYAQDNGAGKTQLMALFATGAAQQIAIEP